MTGGGVDIFNEQATPSDLLLIWLQFCQLKGGPAMVTKERIFSRSAHLHVNLKLLSKLKHNFSVELTRRSLLWMGMSIVPTLPEEESAPPSALWGGWKEEA